MMTIRVRANVSESRQLVLTLPPEVQLGEHEFEVTVRDAVVEPECIEVILPPRSTPAIERILSRREVAVAGQPLENETPEEYQEYMASIQAYREEIDHSTGSGKYAGEYCD